MNQEILLLGGLLLDRYFHIDRWPARGQDGFLQREESHVGGCSINMAVTIRNLGGEGVVVSCIGTDRAGEEILRYLEAHGLSTELVYALPGTTGSCLVFSEPEGERTFLTHKGRETVFPPELARKVASFSPAWAGITGYYLLADDPGGLMDCLEALHQGGTRFLFDPSPMVHQIDPEILARMVAISDILTPNSTELAPFGADAGISALTGAGKTVILTRGGSGGTVYGADETFSYASAPCTPVDTTGAGDSFAGALLYALTRGLPLRQGIDLAARCAAKTCEISGPHGFWKLEGSNHA